MECYICGELAQTWPFAGGGRSVDCVECSRYNISGTVLEVKRLNNYHFDIEQTRVWLHAERDIGHYPPFIQSGTERWALQSGR